MAQITRSARLLRKAEAALLSAIEVYNKPDFKYREETFTILMLNAWELLLKAKLVADNGNSLRCILVYETRETRTGKQSKKTYLRRNRSGNRHTRSLGQVVTVLDKENQSRLPPQVKSNLDALTEIRDNAVHYFNASPQLAKQVLEIGTASVKNFIELARRWFSIDLSGYGLYLMPIGFVSAPGTATAIPASADEGNLVRYLAEVITASKSDDDRDFNVALEVNLSFKRAPSDAVAAVAVTTDPNAPKVTLSEEDVRKAYPWDYGELIRRLRKRYSDFKTTAKFHGIRKPVMSDPKYVRTRYLDPANVRSGKKDFYNANIVNEFDRHYTRRP
jgi:hypothetical protein